MTKGAFIGPAGSVTGAVLGLAAATAFAGQLRGRLPLAAAAAVVAGIAITTAGALLRPVAAQPAHRCPAR